MWERITGGYERDEDRVNELWRVEGGGGGGGDGDGGPGGTAL